jgi:hypothetical protein
VLHANTINRSHGLGSQNYLERLSFAIRQLELEWVDVSPLSPVLFAQLLSTVAARSAWSHLLRRILALITVSGSDAPMNRFLDPYYFVNTLLLLVYGGLRAYFVYLTPEGGQHSRFQDLQDFAVWVSRCSAATPNTLAGAPAWRQLLCVNCSLVADIAAQQNICVTSVGLYYRRSKRCCW